MKNHTLLAAVCLVLGYGLGYWQYGTSTATVANKPISAFEQFAALNDGDNNNNNDNDNDNDNDKGSAQGNNNGSEHRQQSGAAAAQSTTGTLEKLSQLEGISYTDFARLSLSPTVDKVTDIIDSMSPGDLNLAINTLTGLDKDEIKELGDLSNFSKSLVQVVMRNSSAEKTNKVASISFGTEANSDNSVTAPQDTFTNSTNRIYASFSLPQGAHEKIMVKWFRNSPYTLQIMNRYHINPHKEYNYVWFRPSSWAPGLYSVEVFAMNSDLTLLASGNFEITE